MTLDSKGMKLGRYLLGERLAVGGMGEVRLAVQFGLGRFEKPLAIKLLLPHLAAEPTAVEMFLDEARLASRMNHPNIVQIFDVGVEDENYFIAMELVLGVSTSTLIRQLRAKQAKLSPAVLEHVGRALCEGLHHAHELTGADGRPLELVHRDVTPHNLLVSVAGEVKLTDFGIAKARDTDSHTRHGSIKGKLEYLSPEQTRGKQIDRRADIFGAGVTLFHLASLVSPFKRDTSEETLASILQDELPDLADLRPDLSPSFTAAIAQATSKDPKLRFATARAFRDAIAPSSTSDAAEELGRCVRELCQESVERLEQKTRVTFSMHSSALGGTQARTEPAGPGRSGRSFWLGVGLTAALFLLLGAWMLLPGEKTPLPASTIAVPVVPIEPSQPAVESAPRLAPPPAPRQESKVGFLNIDAVPWATVEVNGKKIGETPIAGYPIAAGPARIRLANPKNGKVVVRHVRVIAGKDFHLKENLR